MATKGGGYVVHFSIVDNRLAMEMTNRFRLRYGTLAQHFFKYPMSMIRRSETFK